MDSRLLGHRGFAFAMTWRTLLAAAFVVALIEVLLKTQYYATAIVMAALALLTIADATRLYGRLGASSGENVRVLARGRALQLDRMAALLDAVTVALIAVQDDGRIAYANRAARLFMGEEVGRLSDIKALGPDIAKRILALSPGARQIVALEDGRTMLVWVGAISAPGMAAERLISLQAVTGELDAVQVRAWSDMVRVLSHEMMNSLTPISSLSESLPQLLETGGAADAAATIARRSRHLLNFVERYRRIADLPAPSLREISLPAFLADMDALMRAHLSPRGIQWRGAEATGALGADPDLLAQALINLLHNAADAALANPNPAIALDCLRTESETHFIVSDNGAGIAPEHLPEIFVPFFTTKKGGAGIGLTLARQIALAHGGRIAVESRPEGGAIFTLAVPNKEDLQPWT